MRALDREPAKGIERMQGLGVILNQPASTDLPSRLGRELVGAGVSAAERSLSAVLSRAPTDRRTC